MRDYIAAVKKPTCTNNVGELGERAFVNWFESNYQDSAIHKQTTKNDYAGIDFICDKGLKYQVKATSAQTYTFNHSVEDAERKLVCDFYVFVEITPSYCYIVNVKTPKQVMSDLKKSIHYKNSSFIWKADIDNKFVDIEKIKR